MAKHWSDKEVEAAIADYFCMLRLEITGAKYNKTKHRNELKLQLQNRTDGSVEFKHQNISAVLIEMGIPYIEGYKPLYNYQRALLPAAVTEYLTRNPELQSLFTTDSEATPSAPAVKDLLATWQAAPEPEGRSTPAVGEPQAIYNPGGVNYLEREAQNQLLGEAGEQFVMNYERARLISIGKDLLADRVEQVSATVGPSAGFDILSFEQNGAERFIEAKTTKYGKNTPFYITPNELRFSKSNASNYYLYRVFKFRESPGIFALQGDMQDRCTLKPSAFIARPA